MAVGFRKDCMRSQGPTAIWNECEKHASISEIDYVPSWGGLTDVAATPLLKATE